MIFIAPPLLCAAAATVTIINSKQEDNDQKANPGKELEEAISFAIMGIGFVAFIFVAEMNFGTPRETLIDMVDNGVFPEISFLKIMICAMSVFVTLIMAQIAWHHYKKYRSLKKKNE